MIICTARNNTEILLLQSLSHSLGIVNNLLSILLESRGKSFLESNCLSCNNVHQRAALNAREYSLIELLAKLGILTENHTTARTTQSFMGSSCYYICIWYWRRMQSCSYQTSDMSNIYHEICTYRMSNFCQTREVKSAGICRSTSNNQLRLALLSNSLNLIIIQSLSFFTYAIRYNLKVLARHIYWRTMSQMAAISKVHTHYSIARSQKSEKYCHISLCTGMRLNICIFCTKKLLSTINSQLLYHIYMLTATIVTLARITLCILISKDTALSCHNCSADNIFRCNQLQLIALTMKLLCQYLLNLRINTFQTIHQCHNKFLHLLID